MGDLIMRDFQLSKYGFRLNLQGVLKVTSWCGLIYYVIMCAIGLCLFFIPQFLPQYLNSRIQFFEYVAIQINLLEYNYEYLLEYVPIYINMLKDTMKCVGAVLTIWSLAWFGFFLVLRRNVAKKDIIEIRNLLAKSTFIIGGIFNVVNLVLIIYIIMNLDSLDSEYPGYVSGFCCLFLFL